jgi:hypothetical protein
MRLPLTRPYNVLDPIERQYPLESDLPIVRRLAPSGSSSLPAILSAETASMPKMMLHEARMIRASASQQSLAETKQLRRALSMKIAQSAPLAFQTEKRRKMMMRQKSNFEADLRIQKHRDRMVDDVRETLTTDQTYALSACFMALEVEKPVGPTSRIPGTINLDELTLALRSFGYSMHEEAEVMKNAREMLEERPEFGEFGLRLTLEDFINVVAGGPKPEGCMGPTGSLQSIGKVIAAVRLEMGEEEIDYAAGHHVMKSEQSRRKSDQRMKSLESLASEAYPFSIVTDAHRISNLISSYSLPALPAPLSSPTRAGKGGKGAPKKSVDVYNVLKDKTKSIGAGAFKDAKELGSWLSHHGIGVEAWGSGSAKAVADLLVELENGDAKMVMVDGKIFRCLSAIRLVVRVAVGTNRHLVCVGQQLAAGRRRKRHQLPSGPLYDDEDPLAVALRAVQAELGALIPDIHAGVKVLDETYLQWDEIAGSSSYPQLQTLTRLHQVDVLVRGLPLSPEFATQEGKTQHLWQWHKDAPDDLRRKPEQHASPQGSPASPFLASPARRENPEMASPARRENPESA